MIGYKLINDKDGNNIAVIKADDETGVATNIILDPSIKGYKDNRDVRDYHAWLSVAGNVPFPADPVGK